MERVVNKGEVPGVESHELTRELAGKFDDCFYELSAAADVLGISTSTTMDQTMPMFNTTISSNNVHGSLPTRKLPTFSGDSTEWQGFEDLFSSILSHIPLLPEVERFEYLKTSLQGDALRLIDHLPINTVNYRTAWDLLRKRYGNKRDLARHHIDALLSPTAVFHTNSKSISQFLTSIQKHVAVLAGLGHSTRQWTPLLLHLFEKNLDHELRSRWELTVGQRNLPTMEEFINFLESQLRSASVCPATSLTTPKTCQLPSINAKVKPTPRGPRVLTTAVSQDLCVLCKESHSVRKCPDFLAKSPKDRYQVAKAQRLCLNCLSNKHDSASCTSKHTCQSCHKKHHTLLHFGQTAPKGNSNTTSNNSHLVNNPVTTCLISGQRPTILLSTMLVTSTTADGTLHTLRAIMDSGSEASFITKRCADRLALPQRQCSTRVRPFACAPVNIVSGNITLTLLPVNKSKSVIVIDALVVPKIIDRTPQAKISTSWSHIDHLTLADPTYHTPCPVDVLLGADIVPSILTGNRVSGPPSDPVAFDTTFGWVLMGPVSATSSATPVTNCLLQTENSLEESITRFWEMEEPPQKTHLSDEESKAEQVFQNSITQSASGRFSIALPFKSPRPILGDSKIRAIQRFKNLEWKLDKDPHLRTQYVDFMKDYLDSNHMELVPLDQRSNPHSYYLPHHCVIRPDSQTTKIRVVFDASSKTTAGISFNESVYTGPKLQADLQHILIRARLHNILFTADIKQMYRQILINKNDRDYLRILWRFDVNKPIDEYRLCTVTYGTSCAHTKQSRLFIISPLSKGTRTQLRLKFYCPKPL